MYIAARVLRKAFLQQAAPVTSALPQHGAYSQILSTLYTSTAGPASVGPESRLVTVQDPQLTQLLRSFSTATGSEGGAKARTSSSSSSGSGSSTTGSEDASSSSSGSGSSTGGSSSSSGNASSSSGDGSSAGGSGFDAFSGFKETLNSFKAKLGTAGASSGDGGGAGFTELKKDFLRDLKAAVLPQQHQLSATRVYEGPRYEPGQGPESSATALAPVKKSKSQVEQIIEDLQKKFPWLNKVTSSVRMGAKPMLKKGAELADDLREKYETSDHPMVHKAEEVKERVFGMSDAASAMHLILSRDPTFDMNYTLAGIKYDAPMVVKAFLSHDMATLEKHCGKELLERFAGIFKHFQSQGLYEDPTILHVGEVELVELKMMEGEPLLVVQFQCQQIKCTRDKFGNVMEGSPNSIQKVFYFWGLQQEEVGVVLPDGRLLPPRWVIKDMLWQSMLALV